MSASSGFALEAVAAPRTRRVPRALRFTLAAAWKTFVAMVLCQTLIGSVLVVGWTYRLMQRSAVGYWRRQSPRSGPPAGRTAWPRWVLSLREPRGAGSRLREFFRPLGQNFKVGVQALLTTWTLTLPACALWQFGWFAGWDNSFNKGYEQTFVGAAIAWFGIGLFLVAMLYLPVAQARHAGTGEWRAFFEFRTNRELIKRSRFSCLFLAMGYAVAGAPIALLTLVPYFAGNNNPALLDLAASEQLAWLNRYYFWTALPLFGMFVALRLAATRIYAAGMLDLLQTGTRSAGDLIGVEREAFADLGILEGPFPSAARDGDRREWRLLGRAGRLVVVSVTVVLWFGLAVQIFVGQFFHYRPVRGWLNQPLIQAPWVRHVPAGLRDAARVLPNVR